MASDPQYAPLLTEDPSHEEKAHSDDAENGPSVPRLSPMCPKLLAWMVFTIMACIIVVQALIISLRPSPWSTVGRANPQALFSPAQEALEYEVRVFSMSNNTIYQGEPSKEVDEAWDGLYNEFGNSMIPKSLARLLPNRTVPIPGDEEHYILVLSVFHQLHCLNLMRKIFFREHYTDPETGYVAGYSPERLTGHYMHCIDTLRQAVMCASDISPIVWQWNERVGKATPAMNVAHSCRSFDKIVEWAKEHQRTESFDPSIHIEDDIEIPIF
ncbi:hypothetical protein K474DRAFT_1636716 [Panus rudis PR-1116 ss-1]|nr:hypothetical protein K474DRAFT_1636716 [Panus rudis PR-1116 ss-1]